MVFITNLKCFLLFLPPVSDEIGEGLMIEPIEPTTLEKMDVCPIDQWKFNAGLSASQAAEPSGAALDALRSSRDLVPAPVVHQLKGFHMVQRSQPLQGLLLGSR